MIRPRNAVPAIKDRKINKFLDLSALPSGMAGGGALMYCDPAYDLEIISISALVTVITTAAATTFQIGYGSFTHVNGTLFAADVDAFLTTALCLDSNNQAFSTQALALGSRHNFIAPRAGTGQPVLPAGAPLIITGTSTGNTGELLLTLTLRPKEKDRGEHSRRPGGAADHPYPLTY